MAVDLRVELRQVLAAWPGVRLALLFGSQATGRARPDSDVDIAVRAPGVDLLELAAALSDAVRREVQVIPLDRADIPLTDQILRDGEVLIEVPGESARWRSSTWARMEWDRPWYQRQRDAVLAWLRNGATVDTGRVDATRVALEHRLARVTASCPATEEDLAADEDALDRVSFNLMQAVQLCADVASHLIADERWAAATSLRESFERLSQHAVIDAATLHRLKRAVGLRNVVAHGYGAVDPAMVSVAARQAPTDLAAFSAQVMRWLDARDGS